MKKFWTVLLTVAAMLALTLPASADILWEPGGNVFYESHREKCDYEGREYLANSEDGFITVWDAPNGFVVKGQFTNGEKLWVYWVYENWGLISYYGEDTVEGWVDLSQMSLVYDWMAFAEEYADRIVPYGGEFADYAGDDAVFNFYEYPGAPEIKREMKIEFGSVVENLTGSGEYGSYIGSIFVDEQGLTWGYVGYMYGHLNGWFCLDDPDGVNSSEEQNFPLRATGEEPLYEPAKPTAPAKSYLPFALIGVSVAVTGWLLGSRFSRKKKR